MRKISRSDRFPKHAKSQTGQSQHARTADIRSTIGDMLDMMTSRGTHGSMRR
jgi:hypothetical protein